MDEGTCRMIASLMDRVKSIESWQKTIAKAMDTLTENVQRVDCGVPLEDNHFAKRTERRLTALERKIDTCGTKECPIPSLIDEMDKLKARGKKSAIKPPPTRYAVGARIIEIDWPAVAQAYIDASCERPFFYCRILEASWTKIKELVEAQIKA